MQSSLVTVSDKALLKIHTYDAEAVSHSVALSLMNLELRLSNP